VHRNQKPCAASLVFITLSRRERLQEDTKTMVLAGISKITPILMVWWNSGGSGEFHFAILLT
jgi:hypothetical protein